MVSVKQNRELLTSPGLDSNGLACTQYHLNAVNTQPETFPKFQKQIDKVIPMWEMINRCLRNLKEGPSLAADDPKMVVIQAYDLRTPQC